MKQIALLPFRFTHNAAQSHGSRLDMEVFWFQTSRKARDRRAYDRDMPHGRVYSWTQCSRDNSNDPGSRTRAWNAHTPSIRSKLLPHSPHSVPIVKRCYCPSEDSIAFAALVFYSFSTFLFSIYRCSAILSFFVLTDPFSSLRLILLTYLRLLDSLIPLNRHPETTCSCASTQRRSEYSQSVATRRLY